MFGFYCKHYQVFLPNTNATVAADTGQNAFFFFFDDTFEEKKLNIGCVFCCCCSCWLLFSFWQIHGKNFHKVHP